MSIDANVMQVLSKALSVADLRQSVFSNNIANAETPGYKQQTVEFESLLNNALNTVPEAPAAQAGQASMYIPNPSVDSIQNVSPEIVSDTSTQIDNNGNNVDVNGQMSELADNQIRYNTLVQDVSDRMNRLKSAITG